MAPHFIMRKYVKIKAILIASILSISSAHATYNAPSSQKDLESLAQALYFEANGETDNGMIAVGEVILNRVSHPKYWKDTIYEVIHEKAQFSYLTQFKDHSIRSYAKRKRAYRIATKLITGDFTPVVGKHAYFYYNPKYAKPVWRNYPYIGEVGNHRFLGIK